MTSGRNLVKAPGDRGVTALALARLAPEAPGHGRYPKPPRAPFALDQNAAARPE
jgi:hypothetical protein